MTRAALFVGDASLDLTMVASHVPAPDEKVHVETALEAPGGVIANAAVACARTGIRAHALLQLGNDMVATQVVAGLQAQAVIPQVEQVPGRTCRVVILLEPHGEKRLLLDPGVSMYPAAAQIAATDLTPFAWVHTASYGAAAFDLVARCRAAGLPWSLDLEPASFASGLEAIAPLLDGAAMVFCNNRAAAQIGGSAPAHLLGMGVQTVIRTMGAQGARLIQASRDIFQPAPSLAAVVDTTGAGDCIAGWLIGETLLGAPQADALYRAVLAASLSCLGLGAQHSYPHPADIDAWHPDGRPSQPSFSSETI